MAPDPGQDEGFSMVELMVVVLLMSIVMMGLFSLQDALLQQRGRILRNIMVRNQNDYARRVVMRELASTTLIQEPAVGATSNNLVGWKGLDPTNMYCCNGTCRFCNPAQTNLKIGDPNSCLCSSVAGISALPLPLGATIEWFRLCLDSTGQRLAYHRGAGFLLPNPMPACGTNATEILAGFSGATVGQAPGMVFSRTRSNWIDVNFGVNVEGAVPSVGTLETAKAETHVGIAIMATNQPGTTW